MAKDQFTFENAHGSSAFPAEVILNHTSMTGRFQEHFVYCHWHRHMEFIYVTNGRAAFEIDSKVVEVSSGEVLMVNCNELHSGYALGNSPCSLYAFIFDPAMLSFANNDVCQENYIDPFVKGKFKMPSLIKGDFLWEKNIASQIALIIERFKQPHIGYELEVKAALYSIFASLIVNHVYIENTEETEQKKYKIEKIKKVLSHIKANYREKIYINELAAVASMSTDHFFKFFKSFIGKTPIEYINFCRISEAEHLLVNSQLSILEIALSIGYENVSYFIKTFKKYNMCTPKEYRKCHF